MLRNAVDRGVAGDVVRRALEGEARALEELGRPSGTVAELARLGFVVKSGGGYTVPRWVVELLRVRGLC